MASAQLSILLYSPRWEREQIHLCSVILGGTSASHYLRVDSSARTANYPARIGTTFGTPALTGEEVTKIVASIEDEMRTLFILGAATGLRADELLGLSALRWPLHQG